MAVRFAEFAGRAAVHRRLERRWEMRVGGRAISVSHVRLEQAYADGGALPAALCRAAPDRRPFRTAAATIAGLFAGLVVILLATQSYRASARGGYSLSLAVPPTRRSLSPAPAARSSPPARTRMAAARRPVMEHVIGSETANVTEDDDGSIGPDVPYQTSQRALDAALTTGTMQQWAEPGGRHGYVVAGPQEAGSGQQCRQLSILTREAGEADQVDVRRICLPIPR